MQKNSVGDACLINLLGINLHEAGSQIKMPLLKQITGADIDHEIIRGTEVYSGCRWHVCRDS